MVGKTTIHPLFFYSGKIFGYITWIFSLASIFNISIISRQPIEFLKILSYVLFIIGLIIVLISLINYKFSRNPMYLGFDLFTLASIVFTANIIIAIIGIYSIIIYHYIIIGEENFLEKRFGNEYITYKRKVRRYV